MPAWMRDLGLDEKLNKKHRRKVNVRYLFGVGGGREDGDIMFFRNFCEACIFCCDTSVT